MSLRPDLPACSVLLLSGGQGRRMGGQDKGLIEWQGRPLIAWMHELVRSMSDDLIISCNRNADRYARWADQLVRDDVEGFPGPLAGIRAGLATMRHNWLLVLPCDAPLIDLPLLTALREAAASQPGVPVMIRHGEQWEPLFCCLPRSLADKVESAWESGERSPRRVLLSLRATALDCESNDPRLLSLNTPELLAGRTR